ncbi:MAG: hypothetical protein HY719_02290, partial [Planctomycetes bacterium]|nr:hypothetical protein [Planctomycetota bacterium]
RLLAAAGQVGVAADLSGLYAIAARERDVPTRGEALVAVLRIGDAEQERRVRDIVSADAGLRDYVRGVVATERVTVGGAAAGPADETVRYLTRYDDKFFLDGAPPLDLSAEMVRPIGVHVDLGGADLSLQNVANEVFRHSPLDRYRGAFYFRLVNELEVELERDLPSPTAYDSYGLRIPGGKPIVSGQVGFYLYFNRVDRAACGCAGFSAGNEANVTKDSLMHEIGHAFAGLGDEYDSTAASKAPAPNLELRAAPRLKWQGLIDQGHVPADRVPRVEMIGERDDGQYLVPSRRCFMNNHLNPPDERYCPVCQLAIIDAICRITGVAPPWALSTKR